MMDEIRLIPPSAAYRAQIMAFRDEVLAAGDGDVLAGCGTLEDCHTAEEWLESLENPPPGYVPSDTYLAVRVHDDRVVGIIDLRHHINTPVLSTWGGHIGYTVRPTDRRRGYAKEMLRLNLENARSRGIPRVLITCRADNLASERTILANGGVFDSEITACEHRIKRFFIPL